MGATQSRDTPSRASLKRHHCIARKRRNGNEEEKEIWNRRKKAERRQKKGRGRTFKIPFPPWRAMSREDTVYQWERSLFCNEVEVDVVVEVVEEVIEW